MGPALWLALARDDLQAAEVLAEHDLAALSSFHADQAVAKALQAFHVYLEGGRRRTGDGCPAVSDPPDSRPPSTVYRLGARRRGLASALASLALHSASRQPAGEGETCGGPEADAEVAREAVYVAQELVDRITGRVYGHE